MSRVRGWRFNFWNSYYGMHWFDPRWERIFSACVWNWCQPSRRFVAVPYRKRTTAGELDVWPHITPKLPGLSFISVCGQVDMRPTIRRQVMILNGLLRLEALLFLFLFFFLLLLLLLLLLLYITPKRTNKFSLVLDKHCTMMLSWEVNTVVRAKIDIK